MVFATSFLFIFVLLLANTPSQLFPISTSGVRLVEIPSYWSAFWGNEYAHTWDSSVDIGLGHTEGSDLYFTELDDGSGTFGGWKIQIMSSSSSHFISCKKGSFFWILPIVLSWDSMEIFDEKGRSLGLELLGNEMLNTWSEFERLEYDVKLTGQLQFHLSFGFNTTLYVDPYDAWGVDALYVGAGIDFDNSKNAYDYWSVINQILFFNMPSIGYPVKYISDGIGLSIWVSMLYVASMIFLKFLGVLFGGGA